MDWVQLEPRALYFGSGLEKPWIRAKFLPDNKCLNNFTPV